MRPADSAWSRSAPFRTPMTRVPRAIAPWPRRFVPGRGSMRTRCCGHPLATKGLRAWWWRRQAAVSSAARERSSISPTGGGRTSCAAHRLRCSVSSAPLTAPARPRVVSSCSAFASSSATCGRSLAAVTPTTPATRAISRPGVPTSRR